MKENCPKFPINILIYRNKQSIELISYIPHKMDSMEFLCSCTDSNTKKSRAEKEILTRTTILLHKVHEKFIMYFILNIYCKYFFKTLLYDKSINFFHPYSTQKQPLSVSDRFCCCILVRDQEEPSFLPLLAICTEWKNPLVAWKITDRKRGDNILSCRLVILSHSSMICEVIFSNTTNHPVDNGRKETVICDWFYTSSLSIYK